MQDKTRVLKTSVENKRPKKTMKFFVLHKERIDQYIVLTYLDIYMYPNIFIFIYI